MSQIGIPLATSADQILGKLADATGSDAIARLKGLTLLGERAMLGGMRIPARTSAGGGCRLYDALGDTVALNLSRASDRELLPALFENATLDPNDDDAIAAQIARSDAAELVSRGRVMGLAIAAEREKSTSGASVCAGAGVKGAGGRLPDAPRSKQRSAWALDACVELVTGPAAVARARPAPRVLDLSALWAGPLAAHLLWLAGADVVKVESRTRPDAMRGGDNTFYALLNQGKASVALDFREPFDNQTLLALIAASDIVIEAARPRALMQLGIDAAQIVRNTPGLVWMTVTAHGAADEAANWVGFGDDCAVSGGLSAALRAATGDSGFVGDAIADPLTGMLTALLAWEAWMSGRGGRYALAMSKVVTQCLAMARQQDAAGLGASLRTWSAAVGKPFPAVERRSIGGLPAFGEHTHSCIASLYR